MTNRDRRDLAFKRERERENCINIKFWFYFGERKIERCNKLNVCLWNLISYLLTLDQKTEE